MYEITYLNIEENEQYEKTVKKVLQKCFEEEKLLNSNNNYIYKSRRNKKNK